MVGDRCVNSGMSAKDMNNQMGGPKRVAIFAVPSVDASKTRTCGDRINPNRKIAVHVRATAKCRSNPIAKKAVQQLQT